MTLDGVNKFLDALKAAGIKEYQFDTDTDIHYYNNETNSICVIDESTENVYNIRQKISNGLTPYPGNLYVQASHINDIHVARFGGSYEDIKKFIDAYGLNVTESQLKLLINIDKRNYNLKPLTGDYNFKILSNDEIEKLSPEEKADYEYQLEVLNGTKLPKGVSARIEA